MKQNVLWFFITLRMNKYFSPHSDIKVLLGRLSKSKQAERGFSSSSANSSPLESFTSSFHLFSQREILCIVPKHPVFLGDSSCNAGAL